MSPFRQKYMGFYSFATPKWFKFFVKYVVILCETLYNMYAVGCSVSAQGEPRGAKASGDRSHVTMIAGIGLVQMWHQRASHSLPPPLSLPAFLCLSPPLSLSISVPLCFFFFFSSSPLPFLSIPPSQRWRVSVLLRHPGPNVHTERTPIPRFAAYSSGVSSRCVLHHHCCCCLSALPPPHLPVRVSGSWALGGGGNQHRASLGSCAELAMPCPGILWPAGFLHFCPPAHQRTT